MCVAGACVLVTSVLMNTLTAKPREETLIPVIMGMATANPPYRVSQQEALAVAEQCPECESLKPVLARIYGNSRIDYRHMARTSGVPRRNPARYRARGDSKRVPQRALCESHVVFVSRDEAGLSGTPKRERYIQNALLLGTLGDSGFYARASAGGRRCVFQQGHAVPDAGGEATGHVTRAASQRNGRGKSLVYPLSSLRRGCTESSCEARRARMRVPSSKILN